jgi:hypothetical protein
MSEVLDLVNEELGFLQDSELVPNNPKVPCSSSLLFGFT